MIKKRFSLDLTAKDAKQLKGFAGGVNYQVLVVFTFFGFRIEIMRALK